MAGSRRKGLSLRQLGRDPEFIKRLGARAEAPPARRKESTVKRARAAVASHGLGDHLRTDADGALVLTFQDVSLLSLNTLLRTHDAEVTAYKRAWATRVSNLALAHRRAALAWRAATPAPLILEAIRIRRDGRCLDADAQVGSLKYVIDGLVGSGLLPDDSQQHLIHVLPISVPGDGNDLHLVLRPAPSPYGHISPATLRLIGIGA
jgi:hypothetical protein